jgi:uncharacterized membrane protein YcaP (DUF421 family)
MQDLWNAITQILGIEADTLTIGHMAVRAVVVYLAALLMIRIGEKRFLGKNTAFDVILGIILGSVVSRAITGSSEFFPTLTAGFVLVLLHWLFATLSFYSDWFGTIVKGHNRLLIENGNILWNAMRKSHISENDLMSALRSQANIGQVEEVQEARLERSGDVSVIKKNSEYRVLEIDIAEGIQTVRIIVDRP